MDHAQDLAYLPNNKNEGEGLRVATFLPVLWHAGFWSIYHSKLMECHCVSLFQFFGFLYSMIYVKKCWWIGVVLPQSLLSHGMTFRSSALQKQALKKHMHLPKHVLYEKCKFNSTLLPSSWLCKCHTTVGLQRTFICLLWKVVIRFVHCILPLYLLLKHIWSCTELIKSSLPVQICAHCLICETVLWFVLFNLWPVS